MLSDKAQETYVSLSSDNLSYRSVKATVLKGYELVPEAYRQQCAVSFTLGAVLFLCLNFQSVLREC